MTHKVHLDTDLGGDIDELYALSMNIYGSRFNEFWANTLTNG